MTNQMDIITNNHKRPIIYWYDLTESERTDFDWVNEEDGESFVRYRGEVYALSEFMQTSLEGWTGAHGDSFFSAVLLRYPACDEFGDDYDSVVMGLALS